MPSKEISDLSPIQDAIQFTIEHAEKLFVDVSDYTGTVSYALFIPFFPFFHLPFTLLFLSKQSEPTNCSDAPAYTQSLKTRHRRSMSVDSGVHLRTIQRQPSQVKEALKNIFGLDSKKVRNSHLYSFTRPNGKTYDCLLPSFY
jgi:hypothetical protein